MSWEATCGLVARGAQHGRGRFIRPKRASSANMMRKLQPRLAATRGAYFTLAPTAPGQQIVDRAVAGRMSDRLFIGRLEVVDVQQLARPSGLGNQMVLLRENGMTQPGIAEAMDVSLSTVNRAHMAYDAGGIKALKPKPIGGRQRQIVHPALPHGRSGT
jgi:hypothetical protein